MIFHYNKCVCNVEQHSFVVVVAVAVAVKNRRSYNKYKTSFLFDYGMVYFLQRKLIFVLRSRLINDFFEG